MLLASIWARPSGRKGACVPIGIGAMGDGGRAVGVCVTPGILVAMWVSGRGVLVAMGGVTVEVALFWIGVIALKSLLGLQAVNKMLAMLPRRKRHAWLIGIPLQGLCSARDG